MHFATLCNARVVEEYDAMKTSHMIKSTATKILCL